MSDRFLACAPLLGLVLTVALSLSACDSAPEVVPPPPPQVTVVTVQHEKITPRVEFVGRTRASEDVKIKARVSGPLLERYFREGDDVERGTLLYQIDPATFVTNQRQQQAAVNRAKASYDTTVVRYRRGKELHKKKLLSDMNMDELSNQRLEAEAALNQAQALLETAELELSYTKIYAPISGRISRTRVSIGDLINPEREMADLVQIKPMWVDFQASERDLVEGIRESRENPERADVIDETVVKLILPDGKMHSGTGMIDFVDNRVDPSTGTIAIRASMPNEETKLLPGLYVTVILESSSEKRALLIPQVAVQEDQQGRFVMLVTPDNMVEKRLVSLGNRFGIKWQVLDGLEGGERIIVEGLQAVRSGLEVVAVEQVAEPFAADDG